MTEPTKEQVARFSQFIKVLTNRYLLMEIDLIEAEADLNKSEFLIVELVAWQSCRTVSQIARAGKMPLSSASWLVDRLVERGYLSRRRSKADRRVVELSLTSRGEGTIAHLDRAFENLARDLLAAATQEEREVLLAAVERIGTA